MNDFFLSLYDTICQIFINSLRKAKGYYQKKTAAANVFVISLKLFFKLSNFDFDPSWMRIFFHNLLKSKTIS